MTEVIQVSDLEQGYGKTVVLKDINLTVNSGEILALIGQVVLAKRLWSVRLWGCSSR